MYQVERSLHTLGSVDYLGDPSVQQQILTTLLEDLLGNLV